MPACIIINQKGRSIESSLIERIFGQSETLVSHVNGFQQLKNEHAHATSHTSMPELKVYHWVYFEPLVVYALRSRCINDHINDTPILTNVHRYWLRKE